MRGGPGHVGGGKNYVVVLNADQYREGHFSARGFFVLSHDFTFRGGVHARTVG